MYAVAIHCIDSYVNIYLSEVNREKQRKTKENIFLIFIPLLKLIRCWCLLTCEENCFRSRRLWQLAPLALPLCYSHSTYYLLFHLFRENERCKYDAFVIIVVHRQGEERSRGAGREVGEEAREGCAAGKEVRVRQGDASGKPGNYQAGRLPKNHNFVFVLLQLSNKEFF